jgi:predicted dehydrogenase
MKVRVAVVGIGGIARGAHLLSLRFNKNADVVALCDLLPDRCEIGKKRLGKKGKNVKSYTDYKEMILTEKPDTVHVCTPNYLHSEIAIFALENGCNVLCEKPDAMTVPQVLAMAEAERKSGKTLMVIRNNRYVTASLELKKMIDKGQMGEIYTGRCGWIRKRGIPGKGGWFTTKALSGGGPLIDLGVHMIDLAVYLMGNPKAVAVSGSIYNKFANDEGDSDSKHSSFGDAVAGGTFDVEDLAIGFIKFENGASLQVEFSWASNIRKEEFFVELRGTERGFKWKNTLYELYDGKRFKRCKAFFSKVRQLFSYKLGHAVNIGHFIDVVKNDAEPVYKIEQGINMIKILNAIYESAATGKEIVL